MTDDTPEELARRHHLFDDAFVRLTAIAGNMHKGLPPLDIARVFLGVALAIFLRHLTNEDAAAVLREYAAAIEAGERPGDLN